VSHLLIYHGFSMKTKKNLIAAAKMVIEESQDYITTSPFEQGPWAIPSAWGGKGASLDLFRGFLEAATTGKAGYLTPVERIAPVNLGIHLYCQLPHSAYCAKRFQNA